MPPITVASTDVAFEKKGIPKLIYENSLYEYYKKNYFLASLQFSTLMKDYPLFSERASAINYYISSLSFLNEKALLAGALQKYETTVTVDTYFVLVKNYQRNQSHKEALKVLDNLSRMKLQPKQKDRMLYYKALSLLALDSHTGEILKVVESISTKSPYYAHGIFFQSKLYYRDRELQQAIDILKAFSEKYSQSWLFGKSWIKNKIALLLGQMYFDQGKFEQAKMHFGKVVDGPLYGDALIGSHWASFKRYDYLDAAGKLLLVRKLFPQRFVQDDLLVNLAFLYFYAGEFEVSGKYFDELNIFYQKKKNFAESLINDKGVMKNYIYLFLREDMGITFLENYYLSEEDQEQYRTMKVTPELQSFFELYRFTHMLLQEQTRTSTLINQFKSYLKKRAEFFKRFIEFYKTLRPDFQSLKKVLMEIELPLEDLPPRNKDYIIERLNEALKAFEKKNERTASKLEEQLIKILVFEEYVSYKAMDNHAEIFKMALKMMSMLEKLYGESGNIWIEEVNNAVDDFNKTRATAKRFDLFNNLYQGVEELREMTFQFLSGYVEKEAYRVLTKISTVAKEVEEARKKSRKLLLLKTEETISGK